MLRSGERRLGRLLADERSGGILLLAAAVAALLWVNSPWGSAYVLLRDSEFGPEALHLRLSVGSWAADGLLAVFFFVAGLELKREFVAGTLRHPGRAALPVAAAVGGMVVPAVLFVAVQLLAGVRPDGSAPAVQGWAVPTATDIAFALAVLAVAGRGLPPALRTFLLTLAVVDDLLAITVIAVFYSADLHLAVLLPAALAVIVFAVLCRRRGPIRWLLVPVALVAWALVHASGVHATVAGVLLALTVPVHSGMAARVEHRLQPLSSLVALPIFAFFAAGVTIGGADGVASAATDPVTIGVVAGLLLGKPIGILTAVALATRLPGVRLDPQVRTSALIGLSVLGGIGFTVSLLIGELAYGVGTSPGDHAKIGILLGSLLAGVVGGCILARQPRP